MTSREPTEEGLGRSGPNSDRAAASNPLAQSSSITVSVPETVDVKLVDASTLADYEIWVLLTSILSSAVTGFLVAFVQGKSEERGTYVSITAVFLLMAVACAAMAFFKRRRISKKTKRIRFSIGDPVADD